MNANSKETWTIVALTGGLVWLLVRRASKPVTGQVYIGPVTVQTGRPQDYTEQQQQRDTSQASQERHAYALMGMNYDLMAPTRRPTAAEAHQIQQYTAAWIPRGYQDEAREVLRTLDAALQLHPTTSAAPVAVSNN